MHQGYGLTAAGVELAANELAAARAACISAGNELATFDARVDGGELHKSMQLLRERANLWAGIADEAPRVLGAALLGELGTDLAAAWAHVDETGWSFSVMLAHVRPELRGEIFDLHDLAAWRLVSARTVDAVFEAFAPLSRDAGRAVHTATWDAALPSEFTTDAFADENTGHVPRSSLIPDHVHAQPRSAAKRPGKTALPVRSHAATAVQRIRPVVIDENTEAG